MSRNNGVPGPLSIVVDGTSYIVSIDRTPEEFLECARLWAEMEEGIAQGGSEGIAKTLEGQIKIKEILLQDLPADVRNKVGKFTFEQFLVEFQKRASD